MAGMGVTLFGSNFSHSGSKFVSLEERNSSHEGREMLRLQLAASGRGKVADDLSASSFPNDANVLSNMNFQGTSNLASNSKRQTDRRRQCKTRGKPEGNEHPPPDSLLANCSKIMRVCVFRG